MVGVSSTAALAATAPGLGSAANFAVLSAAPASGGAVTCTNGTITGNVGSTGGAASVTQTSCTLVGSIVAPVAAQVVTDFNAAYAAYAAIPCDQVLTGTLASVTLAPGVYCFDAAAALTGTLTLDGPSTGTWIFKIGTTGTGALTGSSFSVLMAGGGLPCNVSWQVAQAATMTDSDFIGTILAGADITLTRGTFVGDALATAGATNTGATLTGCPPPPPSADIGITKTVSNATPSLGSNVTFTITATNHGPDDATGVQVTDLLPAGLSLFSATPSAGTYDSGTGVWNIGSLANGANATLSIVATVTGTAAATNTATKTAEDQIDPVSANNSASATVTALGADIGITKTVDNATPSLGSNVTFTVTATDHGPDNATGVQVTDLLPAGLSLFSATPSAGTYDSGTGIWNIGALGNGASATLSIVATVTGTGAVNNAATKTAEDQIDPVSANNSDSATVTALGADIAVIKTVDNPTPNLGSNVTFTITAANNGPSNATGLQITDVLPAGLAFFSATPSVGAYDSGTGVWSIGLLTNGSSATLAITATVTSASPITNTASKTAEDQLDPDNVNDTASATVNPIAADIAITKTVDDPTPSLGSNATFTITATNNGPSDATGVQVTDLMPAGLAFVSAVASTGAYDSATGLWTIGPLADGGVATLAITATVNSTSPVTNTATKTAEVQVDLVSGNDTAGATVNPVSADIVITKTVDNATPNLGSNVTFTITATNNGPSNATGIQVTDLLPAGLTFVSATPSVGTYDSATGVWNLGPLANGANATLSIIATATGTAAVTNTAARTAEDQVDPVGGNDTASATVTGQAADIALTKTVDNQTPDLGSNVTFTITATNDGPTDATGVQVTDQLPAGLTFVSATPSLGTYDPATGIWNIGPLANLGNATLSIVATVTGTTPVTNFATKTAEVQPDLVPSNDSASATLTGQVVIVPATILPGLPNTSAPIAGVLGSGSNAPLKNAGLVFAIIAILAGLGVVALAGIGLRRSRRRPGQNPGGPAIGLLAVVLSLATFSSSLGELAPNQSSPGVALAPVTQMIGTKLVSVVPPAPPKAETFRPVAGPITPSRLRIPSIGVDTSIGAVGLRADGSMDAPGNLWTSSWLASGPRPGQDGNAVIAGHRGIGSPALFSHLENLRAGDRIYVSDTAGNELIYVVTRVASLDLSMSTQVAVFGPTAGRHLVLITCVGRFVPGALTYDHRLVVFSKLLPLNH